MKLLDTLLAAAVALTLAPRLTAQATVGQPAPAFTAVDTQGQSRTLGQYKGKWVVLEWTNHDCPFVKKHYTGNMQRLQKAYAAKGVVWLTIVSSAPGKQGHVSPAQADQLTQQRGAAPSAVLLDPEGRVGRAYGAKTTPHMFVIDPAGKLVYAGAIDDTPSTDPADLPRARNYVTATLEAALAGKPVPIATSTPYGCSVKY